ncbi:MAG: DUF3147 family protein [Verrucomicrobiota bacterium]
MLDILKVAVSAIVILLVTNVNVKNPYLSALLISLPLTSIIAMIWMQAEGQPMPKIASHIRGTFWFVLPSLPMFLIMPIMLEKKMNFYLSLLLCCLMTAGFYLIMDRLLKKFGWA